MRKGNREFRARLDEDTHYKIEETQKIIQSKEKTAGAKLLINLGYDRIKDTVNYIDNVTHPLNDGQFDLFMLSLKIHLKNVRKDRKNYKF